MDLSDRRLARNATLSVAGRGVPLVVGLAAIPFVLGGLGPARFGLLAMAWVVLANVGLFDLGLSRSVTRFAAEALGRGEPSKVAPIFWTAAWVQLLAGAAFALALYFLLPLGVPPLDLAPQLEAEAKRGARYVAISVPVLLLSASARGLLEAAQRFGLISVVRATTLSGTFLVPWGGVVFGWSFSSIIAGLVVLRAAEGVVYLLAAAWRDPGLWRPVPSSGARARQVLAFGGWVTVSSLLSPIFMYADRFVVGALVSAAAVAYYVTPFEGLVRLLIIPSALAATVFPAFSALSRGGDAARVDELFGKAVRTLMLIVGAASTLVLVFADGLLTAWVSAELAAVSAPILRVLAVGVLFNALAFVPYALLQGAGRPDLPAKLHLIEAPLFLGTLVFAVSRFGLMGAAVTWTATLALDATLLFAASIRVRPSLRHQVLHPALYRIASLVILLGLSAWVVRLIPAPPAAIPAFVGLVVLGLAVSHRDLLADSILHPWSRAAGPSAGEPRSVAP